MRVVLRWIVVMTLLASTWPALAQVRVSITVGPPLLPVYEQPLCPGEGYIWTPGFWGWDYVTGGYYWVPGTWVLPPRVGLLWTPGYWAWQNSAFVFVRGYWGPVVGFYGGINYGFGYPGHGYYGGRWNDGHFFYNRSVTNVNVTVVHNTYVNNNVVVERSPNRTSYNGGKSGIVARPTAAETAAVKQNHVPETEEQAQHALHARSVPGLHETENKGKPTVLAMARPEASRGRETEPHGGDTARVPSHAEDARPNEHVQPEEHSRLAERVEAPKPPQPGDRGQTTQRSSNEHASKPRQPDNKHEHAKEHEN